MVQHLTYKDNLGDNASKKMFWPFSDLIHDRLKELGVTIEDSKEGTSWRYS